MIRNFISRRLSMNRYGIFQFLKRQVSIDQTKYLELQSQYKITQNIDQQIEIMKSIVNLRHKIDEQDIVSIDTLYSYYEFINNYQTCLRKRVDINQETTDLYNQVFQKFTDQTIFDKVQEKGLFSQRIIDKKFLQFNSLVYLLEQKYESKEFEQIQDIAQKILQFSQELSLCTAGVINYKVQILSFQQFGYVQNIIGQLQEALDPLKQGLELVQVLKQYQNNHSIEFTQSDKEWLFQIEKHFFRSLANIYIQLGQIESCIEYQDKTIQLIKDYEGISLDYVYTLYELGNQFGHLNQFRQLKLIEETCHNLEKNQGYLFLQFQRIIILLQLDQLNKKEYDRIIKLHQEVQIIDDGFQTFYGKILICGIRLKFYQDINKQIDLMFRHITKINKYQVDLLVGLRKELYEEFFNKKFNHNKNVYEKTMLYFQQKAFPYLAEIQREFSQNNIILSVGRQREIGEQMLLLLKDYLTRSIYGNDHNLIRAALEKTFKLFLDNHNYKETLQILYQKFDKTANMPPQIKTQLSKYIQQLQQNSQQ